MEFLSKNKIMSSKSEARRAIINKGLKIDNVLVSDANKVLQTSDFKNDMIKISFGKRNII